MTNSATLGSFGDASNAPLVFRNKIINGDMRIDQRNAGAAVSNTTGSTYPCDRFVIDGAASSKFSGQQSSVAPTGFIKSLSLTSSAATTVGSSDYYRVMHHIEGQNIADLAWGTSSAKPITLSFWAYCSLTGTFSGSIRNSAANRSYPFTYSISTINTWEYKTVTIPGDTTGTWLTDTGIGLSVIFSLGCGSTRIGTAGTWAAANYMGATGETQLVATNGANLRFSGVQLEAGLSATPFEQRPIGMELALCQRYFYQNLINACGTMGGGGATPIISVRYPVTQRQAVTNNNQVVYVSGGTISDGTADYPVTGLNGSTPIRNQTTDGIEMLLTITGTSTAGRGLTLRNGTFSFSAEL